MDTIQQDLQNLFERDLELLIENIEAMPDELVWKVPEGVTNSCGVLIQHLVGNINHFVGQGLGNTGYIRDREREFTNTGVEKDTLLKDVEELKSRLQTIFDKLDNEQLERNYPLDIPFESSTRGILLHLYGHLNYHLGQVNYLRRILAP